MLLSELKNKKIGIWGMGKEGQSMKNALSNHDVVLIDRLNNNENIETLKGCEIIIKSPGISKYSKLFFDAKAAGVTFTTGTNIFLSEIKNMDKRPIIIGITGTKGKSTTSSLIFHGLKKLGKSVMLAGNIGKPVIDLLDTAKNVDYIVIEMSSYHCSELTEFVDYSIVLNLYKEHIDWHITHDNYFNDKLNITNHSTNPAIVNYQDKEIMARIGDKKLSFFNQETGFNYKNNGYFLGNEKVLDKSEVNVIGDHNRINFLAVLALYKILGIDIYNLANVFDDFKPLEHRLEIIGVKDGVKYVDDSISTTPETTIAGIEAFLPSNIIVLMGGYDREQDYTDFVNYIKEKQDKVTVVCMYKTGARLYEKMAGLNAYFSEDLEGAVNIALDAKKNGDIIMLSPASPSYGYFKNFEERGKEFRRLVGC